MTTHDKDKIIAAAKEAGFRVFTTKLVAADKGISGLATDSIERLYDIVFEAGRQAEREECAKVCDHLSNQWPIDDNMYDECAKAIRARSTK